MLWFINLFQTKYGYTTATLALDSWLLTDAPRVEPMCYVAPSIGIFLCTVPHYLSGELSDTVAPSGESQQIYLDVLNKYHSLAFIGKNIHLSSVHYDGNKKHMFLFKLKPSTTCFF